MEKRNSEDGSGSGSESGSSRRSRSQSRSRSGSRSDRSKSHSPASYKSGEGSHRSSPKSGRPSRSHSRTPRSPRTPRSSSHGSHHSGSPSAVKSTVDTADSRSQSPNLQIDDQAGSGRSRSHSKSASRSRSRSGTPKSRSLPVGSKSHRSGSVSSRSGRSRTGSKGSRKSRSRSKSGSVRSTSRSRSRSGSRRSRIKSRSRSGSKESAGGGVSNRSRSGSGSGSDLGAKKKRKVMSDSESEGGGAQKKLKKSAIIDTDSEEDDAGQKEGVTADALFGDANDISSDEEDVGKKVRSTGKNDEGSAGDEDHGSRRSRSRSRSGSRESAGRSDNEDQRMRSRSRDRDDFFNEKEDEPEPIPETRIEVEIPRIVTDLGKDIHFVKLPNFLSVETRPFDQETYEDEIDEEETMDEEGRQRIKLKVSNTIRWRDVMDNRGDVTKESNARFVKWSDGSMSLHLGNEIFDVYRQPLQGDHNHFFIRQGTGLQGQAVFRTKLTFRPHSTESFTHKKMTMSLADRSQKTSGIKILTQVGNDPNADRQYNLKKEEEKLRQAMRKQHVSKPKRSSKANDSQLGANSSYRDHDEGSDDEGGISINAIKNKYKKGHQAKQGAAIYSSDDEDSDMETRRSKKIDKTKVKALSDDDSDASVGVVARAATEDDETRHGDEHNSDDAGDGAAAQPNNENDTD